jgi:hypothetical protein
MQPATLARYKMCAKTWHSHFAHFSKAIPEPGMEHVHPEETFLALEVTSRSGVQGSGVQGSGVRKEQKTIGSNQHPASGIRQRNSSVENKKNCLFFSRLHVFVVS